MTRSVLITRPAIEAATLSDSLAEHGIATLIDPMLHISPMAGARAQLDQLNLSQLQAALITSKQALSGLHLGTLTHLPIFVTGRETARIAKAHGFVRVIAGSHGVMEVAEQIRYQLRPHKGAILYLRGLQISTPLAPLLPDYEIEEVITYRSATALALSPETQAALHSGTIGAVGFFSRRSAATFEALSADADLSAVTAICISSTIAEALDRSRWHSICISPSATAPSFIQTLKDRGW